ncbi:hypothetical protein CPAV1605_477 [seawater metagenome]|uniref:Uncharacterized protein n=1 Tax=seawater metagenome TaxID=1561972 RepID=A0A5E8CLM4_9ZZZZ
MSNLPTEVWQKIIAEFLFFNDWIKLLKIKEFKNHRLYINQLVQKYLNKQIEYRTLVVNQFLNTNIKEKIESYDLGLRLDSGRWSIENVIMTTESLNFYKDLKLSLQSNPQIDSIIKSIKDNDEINNCWGDNPVHFNGSNTFFCQIPRQ